MTDDIAADVDLTPEEQLLADAKVAAAVPPEPIPDAEGLPDEVRDGDIGESDEGDPA